MSATLVWSSKDHPREHILSTTGNSVTRLFNAILHEKFVEPSVRVVIKDNTYRYFPTDDYKHYVIRFCGVRK